MPDRDSALHAAVLKLLVEVVDGPPGDEAYILNPGDRGLLRQLDSISAETASRRPAPDRPPVAAHADHVLYGLELLNRWMAGEENPWADADWNASWRVTQVTDEEWRKLVARLRDAARSWREALSRRDEWDDAAAAGAISSVAHTAYHLGAIRQVLGAVGPR